MFKKKKKIRATLFIFILLGLYGFYALYVALAHNPSFELLSKNTISYSGVKAKVVSDKTKISKIKVSLGTDEKSMYKIYEESNLENSLKEKLIEIPFTAEDEVVKFIKQNNLESLYLYYELDYKNKFFSSSLHKKIKISIDFQPPSINSVSSDSYLYLGGIGFVLYETSKDTYTSYVDTGLDVKFYPVKIEKDNLISNLVFFTCGNSPCKNGRINIIAEDLSGNFVVNEKKIKTLSNRDWKTTNMIIDLDFLLSKYNEIFKEDISSVSIDNFFELTKKLRNENDN